MRSILSRVPTEIVEVVKPNGQLFKGILAHVQPKLIIIEDTTVPVEEADKIIRKLPNNLKEVYIVMDRGFYQAIGSFSAHYQIKVEKEYEGNLSKIAPQTIIVNNNGQHSKTNLNSVDNSVNNYNNGNEIFNELKKLVCNIPEESRSDIIQRIDDMKESCGKDGFVEKYNLFIQNAANHMTVFAPLIPMLTSLLTQ